ncbi:ExbD/TolR family protein [candidate division CSSED10-310 bacterium]|uniref:ExbD/TolR family protein n=1 Tax=candidate division CSSED10-310 bacterium TaxID=2855610 RepID=A0ABV6YYA7_UNCC1
MSSMTNRLAADTMSSINVTPFIDVCLVLLIIFMIVTPFMVHGFNVQVPPMATKEEMLMYPVLLKQLILTVTAEGNITLNQEEIHKSLLLPRIRDLFEHHNVKKVIYFNAEDKVLYGEAIEIMDILRQAGTITIGIVPETIRVD